MYMAPAEKMANPTVMMDYMYRTDIGARAIEQFNPATDCNNVGDPIANGLWSTLNDAAHSKDNFEISSRRPSPISDAQFSRNSGGYIPA